MSLRDLDIIRPHDPEIYNAISAEIERQERHIELIASENYASASVMAAAGTCLTNKYAEGYPGARYYGGCEHVDVVETLAIERAKKLFNAGYANVQPHSGSSANIAVFLGLLEPGDTILGMSLDHGGHLTHGAKVSFSGRIFNAVSYGTDIATGDIDYAEVEAKAKEHKPRMIIAGFSAFSGIVDWARFRSIADSVGAYLLADMAHVSGLIAAGLYPSPIDYADVVTSTTHKTLRGPRSGIILAKTDKLAKKINFSVFPLTQGGPLMHVVAAKAIAFKEAATPEFKLYQQQVLANAELFANKLIEHGCTIVSGGTKNHMFLVDLTAQNISGKDAEAALGKANITVNKNTIPNDSRGPFITSGIRIGTPAITTRGFGRGEVEELANLVAMILGDINNQDLLDSAANQVAALCERFPVYKL
ncbi:MAG: serine hydroxymethyltransferase [Legionellales bacterium]|jgi:glycine hydroxymethyltransferase|nr:serine hydroxymethyltransferase [Legionellales bacterium]